MGSTKRAADAHSGKLLGEEAEGVVMSVKGRSGNSVDFRVFRDRQLALAAAERDSGVAAQHCAERQGVIRYISVCRMKRVISLDDDEYWEEVDRYTWATAFDSLIIGQGRAESEKAVKKERSSDEDSSVSTRPSSTRSSGIMSIGSSSSSGSSGSKKHKSVRWSGQVLAYYSQPLEADEAAFRRAPRANASEGLWGTVFVCGGIVGNASFHFFAQGHAFINYSNYSKEHVLDDGLPYPKSVPLTHATFDEARRVFKGNVDWSPRSIAGASRITYHLTFDESLTRVLEFRVVRFPRDNEPQVAKLHVKYTRWTAKESRPAKDRRSTSPARSL